jgi:chemotaxis signal transduction protein
MWRCLLTVIAPLSGKAAELGAAFDRARMLPFPSGEDDQTENILAIRVANGSYALRISEISRLEKGRRIVAFSTPVPECLGLSGIRGALVPVYSMAALLGLDASSDEAGWLALCGTEEPLALAFGGFEGHRRVARSDLCPAGPDDMGRARLSHVIRLAGEVRPVIAVSLIRQALEARCVTTRS